MNPSTFSTIKPWAHILRPAALIFVLLGTPSWVWAYSQRVICGNVQSNYTDSHGYTWSQDQAYTSGSWGYDGGEYGSAAFPQDLIENTSDGRLYQYERFKPNYRFDLPGPGVYFVKLLFCENWWGLTAKGGMAKQRVFDVRINGELKLDHINILNETGGRACRAMIRTFTVNVPDSGTYTNRLQIETVSYAGLDQAKLSAIEISNQPSLTDTWDNFFLASPSGEEGFRINCGGTKSVDADGTLWMADEAYAFNQRWGYVGGEAKIEPTYSWATPQEYRMDTYREGGEDFKYRVSLPNGTYQVKLIFAEHEYTAAGERVFDVLINGSRVLSHLDVYSHAGAGSAWIETMSVQVTQENLEVSFANILAGQAMLNALEVKVVSVSSEAFLDFIERRSLDFFTSALGGQATLNPVNGLIVDRQRNFSSGANVQCSIASVGFGLAAVAVGKERGWINAGVAQQQIARTLDFFQRAEPYAGEEQSGLTHKNGFFFHFLNMATGKRYDAGTEVSPIDTTLLLAGMLVAAGTFPGTSIAFQAREIIERANWTWFDNSNTQGFVANDWKPETGFSPWVWSGYNEDVLMDIIGLGVKTYPLSVGCWYNMTRAWKTYADKTFMIELANAPTPLFTHIYPQCFLDLRGLQDDKNDYFNNTAWTVQADQAFCLNYSGGYLTYAQGGWGLTAGDSPKNGIQYWAYRAQDGEHDGTVNPHIAGAAVPFAPGVVVPELRRMYFQYKHFLWGRFGFSNSYNLNAPKTYNNTPSGQGWVGPDVIGIDIGAMVLGIENYRTARVWNKFMQNAYVQDGLSRIGMGSGLIDNFENDQSHEDASFERDARWWSNHPETIPLATVQDICGNTSTCLKVVYPKQPGAETGCIGLGQLKQAANMSYYLSQSQISLWIHGRVDMQFQFRDQNDRLSAVSDIFSVQAQDDWQPVRWDYSQLDWKECDPRVVEDILIYLISGKSRPGEFYLDQVELGKGRGNYWTSSQSLTPLPTPGLEPGEVRMYPNPATHQVQFLIAAQTAAAVEITFYNMNGERVSSLRTAGEDKRADGVIQMTWTRHALAPGIYICHIVGRDKKGGIVLNTRKKLALQQQ